jgi:hypothetical protein
MAEVKGIKLKLTCISRESALAGIDFFSLVGSSRQAAAHLQTHHKRILVFDSSDSRADLLRWIFPKISPLVIGAIWWPFGLAMYVWGPIWFSLGLGCMLGLFKCPSCDRQFTSKFSLVWFGRTCQNCHFDIYTLKHKPANS